MERWNGELLFKRGTVSSWEDEKVLEMDGGDGCTTMKMYLNWALMNFQNGKFYVMYILPQKRMNKDFLCHARTFKEGNQINADGFRCGYGGVSGGIYVGFSLFLPTPSLLLPHTSQLPSLVLVFSFLNKNLIFEKLGFSF